MNQQTPGRLSPDRSGYYAAAASWDHDVQASLRRERTIAWVVAAVAAVLAILEGLALLLLTPLKTVTPYAFVVDRQTGFVEAARPLAAGPLTQDAAVTQSYLARYVIGRETFDVTDMQENYRQTYLWSAGGARDQYARWMDKNNPASPVRVHTRDVQVAVVVKSISMLQKGSALVRFDAEESRPGQTALRRSYAAVVGYRYVPDAARMSDRFTNPLGFQVTSYRRDIESLPATPEASAPAAVK